MKPYCFLNIKLLTFHFHEAAKLSRQICHKGCNNCDACFNSALLVIPAIRFLCHGIAVKVLLQHGLGNVKNMLYPQSLSMLNYHIVQHSAYKVELGFRVCLQGLIRPPRVDPGIILKPCKPDDHPIAILQHYERPPVADTILQAVPDAEHRIPHCPFRIQMILFLIHIFFSPFRP